MCLLQRNGDAIRLHIDNIAGDGGDTFQHRLDAICTCPVLHIASLHTKLRDSRR
jgi:hypothetical protein